MDLALTLKSHCLSAPEKPRNFELRNFLRRPPPRSANDRESHFKPNSLTSSPITHHPTNGEKHTAPRQSIPDQRLNPEPRSQPWTGGPFWPRYRCCSAGWLHCQEDEALPWSLALEPQSPPGWGETVVSQLESKDTEPGAVTFSSDLRAGLAGWDCATLKPRISSIFSAALRLATFLLVPVPSAVWFPTFTCIKKAGLRSGPKPSE